MNSSTIQPWQDVNFNGVIYDCDSLLALFENLTDPRHAHGKRYSLSTLLVIILLAKLCGENTPIEIADWAKHHAEELVKLLNLKHSWMPHHNTIRRVFANILDEAEFERLVRDFHQSKADAGDQLAIDGKALRGTRIPDEKKADLVLSVYDVQQQRVLAQEAVDCKENEIVAAPKAIGRVKVAGKVITGDAMHAQRAISAQIVAQGGDYLWVVKENQGRLYQDIEQLFTPDKPQPGLGNVPKDFQQAQKVNGGHGRIETRSIQTSAMLNDYVDWPGIGQVYRLERTIKWRRKGKIVRTSHEIEYGISSLSREKASAKRVLQIRRKHWLIETGLHYRRDVTFREDATRMTQEGAARKLSLFHDLALGLLKTAGYQNAAAGRRYYKWHVSQAFDLLVTGNHPS